MVRHRDRADLATLHEIQQELRKTPPTDRRSFGANELIEEASFAAEEAGRIHTLRKIRPYGQRERFVQRLAGDLGVSHSTLNECWREFRKLEQRLEADPDLKLEAD